MKLRWIFPLTCLAALLIASPAQAHFLWLLSETAPGQSARTVHLYFAEAAEPDDPDLLDRVKDPAVWQMTANGKQSPLDVKKGEASLVGQAAGDHRQSVAFGVSHTYGALTRGESTFLLKYYAKTFSSDNPAEWARFDTAGRLALDVVPAWKVGRLTLTVLWNGKPLSGAEVKVNGDNLDEELEAATSKAGRASFPISKPGLYSIRAKHVEQKSGQLEGQEYADVRHYSTLALHIPAAGAQTADAGNTLRPAPAYAPLAEAISSFGGAVDQNWLYVYSGHTGTAHQHSADNLSRRFARLNLLDRMTWEVLPPGEPLQGTALVARAGKLYRVGGMSARNKRDEESDLHSVASAACFDTRGMSWHDLPALPRGRSSHDAAVLGDKLYVFGGWTLRGEEESLWHQQGLVLDLTAKKPNWEKIDQPFQRRAVAVAAHDGKLYVFGGIGTDGDISHEVHVFTPKTGQWSLAPEIPGFVMNGFGSTAWSLGGELYLSGMDGRVYRLNDQTQSWDTAATLAFPRFFHRLLPAGDSRLLAVGGASAGGHTRLIEAVDVGKAPHQASVTTWALPFPGRARRGQSVFVRNNSVYLVGGNRSAKPHAFDADNFLAEGYRIDLNEKTVRPIADLPLPRQSLATAVIGDRRDATAYAVGGFGRDENGARGFADVFKYDFRANKWETAQSKLPAPLFMHGLAVNGSTLWVFGGRQSNPHSAEAKNELSDAVFSWNTEQTDGTFQPTKHRLPRQRHAFAGAVFDGKYYLVGGMGNGFQSVSETDVFDLNEQTWSTIPSPVRPRVFGELATLDGKLYLAGGFSSVAGAGKHRAANRSIEVYDPQTKSWSVLCEELPAQVREVHLLSLKHRLLLVATPVNQEGAVTLMFIDPASTPAATAVAKRENNGAKTE